MQGKSSVSRKGHACAWGLTVAVGAVAIGLAACNTLDELLEVQLPGELTTSGVFQPRMAETVVLSAVAEIECGLSNVTASGSGREDVGWRTSALYGGWNQYQVERASSDGDCDDSANAWYLQFQGGRAMAEQIYGFMENWTDEQVPDRRQLMAVAATYAGIAYQFMGETFCELAVDGGPVMSPQETLRVGEDWLDQALSDVGSSDFAFRSVTTSVRQLARMIRARVRFALGDDAGAAEDAQAIQPGFIAYVTRDGSPESRRNMFYWHHQVNNHFSIAGPQPDEQINDEGYWRFTGYRDLRIDDQGRTNIDGYPLTGNVLETPDYPAFFDGGVVDPRVPVERRGEHNGNDGQTPMYDQLKYTGYEADQPLARWAEAQLILAEIEQGQSAVDRINAVRDAASATYGVALPHFASNDPTEIHNAVLEEFRREFFIETRWWAWKLREDLYFPRGQGQAVPLRRGINGQVTCQLMPEAEYDVNTNINVGTHGDGSDLLMEPWPLLRHSLVPPGSTAS